MVLYHGSRDIIREPQFGAGSPFNDYGLGFYCTEHGELAKEWACTEGRSGFANCYELDDTGLSILNLSDDRYTTLHWLALLLKNRRVRLTTPVARDGFHWLQDHFAVDLSSADLIIGYRADDAYFSFARAFLNNAITLDQLSFAMRLGKLGEQIVLKSEHSFKRIRFLSAEAADGALYGERRRERDAQARLAFERELEVGRRGGIYMQTILDEEMTDDDARLR